MTNGARNKNEYIARRVLVVSRDGALVRKIALALEGVASVSGEGEDGAKSFDLVLLDRRARWSESGSSKGNAAQSEDRGGEGEGRLDGAAQAERREGNAAQIIDRGEWAEGMRALPYPFAFRELRELVAAAEERGARLKLEADGRHASLDGERIRLTESEHRLLCALAEGGGVFVCREELVRRAFGEGADGGILNVYIHYLREKLERGGEKIILSSRRGGYRIDEKYLGEGK